MAYVLALRPQSPLKRSFSDNPYLSACSPQNDTRHAPPIHVTACNSSARSFYSLGHGRVGDGARVNENTPPLTSQSLLNLASEKTDFPFTTADVAGEPPTRNGGLNRPPPYLARAGSYEWQHVPALPSEHESLDGEGIQGDENDFDETHLFNVYEAIHVPSLADQHLNNATSETHDECQAAPATVQTPSQPFRRWMSTLRCRHAQRWREHLVDSAHLSGIATDGMSILSQPLERLSMSARRTNGSLTSSMEYVTAIKSTTITVGSTSIAPRSDGGLQGKTRLGNRSSNVSEARRSLESYRGALGPVLDESAWLRSLQRRKVVEELIASEESYIADLKVLINVCHVPASTASGNH